LPEKSVVKTYYHERKGDDQVDYLNPLEKKEKGLGGLKGNSKRVVRGKERFRNL